MTREKSSSERVNSEKPSETTTSFYQPEVENISDAEDELVELQDILTPEEWETYCATENIRMFNEEEESNDNLAMEPEMFSSETAQESSAPFVYQENSEESTTLQEESCEQTANTRDNLKPSQNNLWLNEVCKESSRDNPWPITKEDNHQVTIDNNVWYIRSSNGQVMSIDMNTPEGRISTFNENWSPLMKYTPKEMAMGGFYFENFPDPKLMTSLKL